MSDPDFDEDSDEEIQALKGKRGQARDLLKKFLPPGKVILSTDGAAFTGRVGAGVAIVSFVVSALSMGQRVPV